MSRDDSTERDPSDTYDDPVARTLLDGSEFHRRRLAVGITQFSQRRKLLLFASVAGSLALCLPIGVTLPETVRESFLGGVPLAATPAVLVLGLFGLAVELVAGLAVAAVSYQARATTLTEHEALHLVAIDNVATMAGLGVGTLAVFATLCGFAVGYGGVEAVQVVSTPGDGGTGPYSTPPLPVASVGVVGSVALLVGVLLAALGVSVGAEA